MGVRAQREPPPKQPETYTEIFEEHFPFYLSIGMTHEQYWDGDNHLPSAYRKAYELERNRVNADQWRQGAYIHNALLSALSGLGNHPHPYLDAPFPLTEAEAEMQDDERARRKYEKARAEFLGR